MFDQSQFEAFRKQAASAGFGSNALVDILPNIRVIRTKLNIPVPANQKVFTMQFAQGLATMLRGMNISVKTHVSEEEKGDGAIVVLSTPGWEERYSTMKRSMKG